jgi:hypothetical protein
LTDLWIYSCIFLFKTSDILFSRVCMVPRYRSSPSCRFPCVDLRYLSLENIWNDVEPAMAKFRTVRWSWHSLLWARARTRHKQPQSVNLDARISNVGSSVERWTAWASSRNLDLIAGIFWMEITLKKMKLELIRLGHAIHVWIGIIWCQLTMMLQILSSVLSACWSISVHRILIFI